MIDTPLRIRQNAAGLWITLAGTFFLQTASLSAVEENLCHHPMTASAIVVFGPILTMPNTKQWNCSQMGEAGSSRKALLGDKWRHRSLANGGRAAAQRRTAESAAVAKSLGVTSQVLDIHDGELEPTLRTGRLITKVIREWKADIVIAHRPWDYHPDHRYVGILVQDAAFMVTVPFFCPDTPYLKKIRSFFIPVTHFRSRIHSDRM